MTPSDAQARLNLFRLVGLLAGAGQDLRVDGVCPDAVAEIEADAVALRERIIAARRSASAAPAARRAA